MTPADDHPAGSLKTVFNAIEAINHAQNITTIPYPSPKGKEDFL
jgi:hypothetical protein